MLNQQRGLERIGMVKIDFLNRAPLKGCQIPVVGVVLENRNLSGLQAPENLVRDGGLAGTGSSGDSDHNGNSFHTD